jgi:hypothetical protein
MVYVAGDEQPTVAGLKDATRVRDRTAYEMTLQGDGSVSHALGVLRPREGYKVDAFFVADTHGNLTSNDRVLAALDELLLTGRTKALNSAPSTARASRATQRAALATALQDAQKYDAADVELLRAYAQRAQARDVAPTGDAGPLATPSRDPDAALLDGVRPSSVRTAAASIGSAVPWTPTVSVDERRVEDAITRHLLGGRDEARRASARQAPFSAAKIEIGVEHSGIESIHERDVPSTRGDPIDALAVGHYLGVAPQAAERALDIALSRALPGKLAGADGGAGESDLLLTQYTERGTLRGELGQPFFIDDSRDPGQSGRMRRVVAIAGMGMPGRFGVPELTVLARELCWSLGRTGRRHLATVLIGAGNGNLSVSDAVGAWLRGVKHAVTGSSENDERHLRRITFAEFDPRKVVAIHEALLEEIARQDRSRFDVQYDATRIESQRETLRQAAVEQEVAELNRRWERTGARDARRDPIPTRITVGLDRATSTYRFGAITSSAAIPEREIPLDSALVMRANDELAAEWEPAMQWERGLFMERLLIPQDLRTQLTGDSPVVLVLDATTARIHWEVMAQSDSGGASRGDAVLGDSSPPSGDPYRAFLGTSRGLTRQLRTTFAPPPEPPPPPRRVLRVLVVADPAEDARLPGAEAEGVEVADLFEQFNQLYEGRSENRVQVVRLIGPREATRTNVLRHLILRSFDAFHFAGHVAYDVAHPATSGFVFSGGDRLTANELRRIDRIPKFVFSNACESGLTPDRSELRSVDLAPSFAESFFERGVSNFVCTAWPVDDAAAREFALTLYEGLLGVARRADEPGRYTDGPLHQIHEAMREARLAIASTAAGTRTWGAYQHYGSPNFRFFNHTTSRRPPSGDART